jgi:hypothetical protein
MKLFISQTEPWGALGIFQMALTNSRFLPTLYLLITLLSFWFPTGEAKALTAPQADDLPTLQAFVNRVKTGKAEDLVGVYVPEVFAAQVAMQPTGDAGFVTPRPNFVTQFSLASRFGSTGLLAHNYLAGKSFSQLSENQTFHLIYGDGSVSTFMVTDILRYQALEPNSVSSTFKDLDNSESLTSSELFLKVYNRPGMVIFQTCISANGNSAWGRLFIIAEPLTK